MSDLTARNEANTQTLLADALAAPAKPEVTPEQRAALVETLEGHADWHDDNVFAGRYWVPVDVAADAVIDAGWKP